jgi:predicted RNA binding protein with dsRBD fold (UPF0201 family)
LFSPDPLELEVIAEAQVKWTESRARVAAAISNVFHTETGELRAEDDRVQFISDKLESLKFLKDQFRDRRVRSAARRLALKNRVDDSTHFLLNKQAAFVKIAALCDDPKESALGPITIRIRSNNLDHVINWLTEGYDRTERS